MKILYLVDYYQPQLGYGEYYVPRELAKLGHEVIILTTNFYYPFPNYEQTSGKILGPREHNPSDTVEEGVRVIRKKMWFEFFTRSFYGGHLSLIKEFQPDLILINKIPGYNAVITSILKPFFKYKIVAYDAHLPSGYYDSGNVAMKNLFYFWFRFFFAALLNKQVDKFIAVQEKTTEIIHDIYGIRKRIVHIPIGTDIDRFHFDSKMRESIRKKYKIDPKDFVIIYTGKVISTKGVDILFKSFDILCKKYDHLKLMIVGNGDRSYISVCENNLDKKFHHKVIWVPFQLTKDLYKFYSSADVGVWPLEESQSMNDAAACNLPFIANHTVGARARLGNNNALLYKKGDAFDLAKQIELLVKDPKKSKQMGLNGRELMENKLSWSSIVKEYIKL